MIRWSWKRTGIALFLAFSANGIQSLISPLWHYSHPLLDLPLLVTIFYATLYPTTGALLMGWTTGLFQDLFSGNALGVNALSKLVVAYLATTLEEKIEIQDLLLSLLPDNKSPVLPGVLLSPHQKEKEKAHWKGWLNPTSALFAEEPTSWPTIP